MSSYVLCLFTSSEPSILFVTAFVTKRMFGRLFYSYVRRRPFTTLATSLGGGGGGGGGGGRGDGREPFFRGFNFVMGFAAGSTVSRAYN
jgi:hypothetical protein